MSLFSIALLIATAIFAITLGYWYGRGQKYSKNIKQSALIRQQKNVKQKRLSTVESFIKSNYHITNREVQELLKVSRATAERYLDQLEQDGKVEQRGAGRGAHYVVK